MQSWLGRGALVLAMIGGIGLAAFEQPAQDHTIGAAGTIRDSSVLPDLRPIFADEESTGSLGRAAISQVLPLSDEERGFVFLAVMNLPDVPELDFELRDPATLLPAGITLYDLPQMVTHSIPLLIDYKFVKLDDRILLIDPVSRAVVSQIPRYRLVLQ